MDLSTFDAIYLYVDCISRVRALLLLADLDSCTRTRTRTRTLSIDLCEPLLEVARKRFAKMGLKNVHCLRQDATYVHLRLPPASLSCRSEVVSYRFLYGRS